MRPLHHLTRAGGFVFCGPSRMLLNVPGSSRMISCLLGILSCLVGVSSLHVPPMMPSMRSAFSATRSSSILGGSQRSVTFDRVLANLGGDFNMDTGRFRCRIPGAYYFTFTVGKFPKKLLSVMLVKNGQEVQAMAYAGQRTALRKVQSQGVMISLRPTDTVWLLLQQSPDYALYSNAGPYITFSGYLVYPEPSPAAVGYVSNHLPQPEYLPPGCPPPADPRYGWMGDGGALAESPRSAFSVARTSPLLGENGESGGEKRALTFDVEYVNIGGHFNKTTGRFTCRFAGTYFFAFTVGKHPRRAVSVKLVTGRGEVRAMVYDEDTSRRRQMQSQSLLLPLKQGESVWLYSQPDKRYAVYSNQGRYTTFSGFLVYPDVEPTGLARTSP